jgi:hypothetical protein
MNANTFFNYHPVTRQQMRPKSNFPSDIGQLITLLHVFSNPTICAQLVTELDLLSVYRIKELFSHLSLNSS